MLPVLARGVMTSSSARLPVVGVMGSGNDPYKARAFSLGAGLAGLGVHILTGGGQGAMASVSRGFFEVPERAGLVFGVVPASETPGEAPVGYPNAWVEVVIRTHLPASGDLGTDPMSRNHINILSADVIVALPGGAGTRSEVQLAARYGRPIIAYVESRAELPGLPADVPTAADLDAVLAFVRRTLGDRATP